MNMKYIMMFLDQRIQLLEAIRELGELRNRKTHSETCRLLETQYILSAIQNFTKDD